MKKWGYYIFNTIIMLVIMALVNMCIAFYYYGIILEADMGLLFLENTDEEIIEKYSDDEIFNQVLKRNQETKANYEEQLKDLEVGTDEYKKMQLNIDHIDKHGLEIALYNAEHHKYDGYIREEVIIADACLLAVYVVGMVIFVKVKNCKKPVKKSKK